MISKGNRIEGNPYLIDNNSTSKLERIALTKKEFQEDWIQELINNQSDIIPVNEIEPIFSTLIPIGKEVGTESGSIDNLFISPSGYITIAEAKLWRNPEAIRKVVAQIIDYAKDLNKWTYTDLNNSVKDYNLQYNNNSNGIIETIKEINRDFDENNTHKLIDRISKNLKQGKFLLLIIGDGIRENVEEMIEFLNKTPQLYFTLALVELQVYNFQEELNKMLVIPQIITRTTEVTRAVIKIESDNQKNISVIVPTEDNEQKKTRKRFTITANDYFEELKSNTNLKTVEFAKQIMEDSEQKGYQIEWLQSSFRVILHISAKIKVSLLIIYKTGEFYLGWSGSPFVSDEMVLNYAINTAKIIPSAIFSENKKNWERSVNIEELVDNYEEFMTEIDIFADKIQKEYEKNN